jgi:hypothetical protein
VGLPLLDGLPGADIQGAKSVDEGEFLILVSGQFIDAVHVSAKPYYGYFANPVTPEPVFPCSTIAGPSVPPRWDSIGFYLEPTRRHFGQNTLVMTTLIDER